LLLLIKLLLPRPVCLLCAGGLDLCHAILQVAVHGRFFNRLAAERRLAWRSPGPLLAGDLCAPRVALGDILHVRRHEAAGGVAAAPVLRTHPYLRCHVTAACI
jgi:hypothetical protein